MRLRARRRARHGAAHLGPGLRSWLADLGLDDGARARREGRAFGKVILLGSAPWCSWPPCLAGALTRRSVRGHGPRGGRAQRAGQWNGWSRGYTKSSEQTRRSPGPSAAGGRRRGGGGARRGERHAAPAGRRPGLVGRAGRRGDPRHRCRNRAAAGIWPTPSDRPTWPSACSTKTPAASTSLSRPAAASARSSADAVCRPSTGGPITLAIGLWGDHARRPRWSARSPIAWSANRAPLARLGDAARAGTRAAWDRRPRGPAAACSPPPTPTCPPSASRPTCSTPWSRSPSTLAPSAPSWWRLGDGLAPGREHAVMKRGTPRDTMASRATPVLLHERKRKRKRRARLAHELNPNPHPSLPPRKRERAPATRLS